MSRIQLQRQTDKIRIVLCANPDKQREVDDDDDDVITMMDIVVVAVTVGRCCRRRKLPMNPSDRGCQKIKNSKIRTQEFERVPASGEG